MSKFFKSAGDFLDGSLIETHYLLVRMHDFLIRVRDFVMHVCGVFA